MLVLSRKEGQVIQIGPNIRVTVLKAGRNSTRLGIEAPEEISIRRGELASRAPSAPVADGDSNPMSSATLIIDLGASI